MNMDILGISELKWTGMGEFNLDSFIYSEVYSISPKGFLPKVVDIMVV